MTEHGVTHFTCNHRPLEAGEISGCCGCDPCESCKHMQARSFAEVYREAEAGAKLAKAIEAMSKWPEPAANAGEGGFGPLFTSGLLMQYKADRETHEKECTDALQAYNEAVHGP